MSRAGIVRKATVVGGLAIAFALSLQSRRSLLAQEAAAAAAVDDPCGTCSAPRSVSA